MNAEGKPPVLAWLDKLREEHRPRKARTAAEATAQARGCETNTTGTTSEDLSGAVPALPAYLTLLIDPVQLSHPSLPPQPPRSLPKPDRETAWKAWWDTISKKRTLGVLPRGGLKSEGTLHYSWERLIAAAPADKASQQGVQAAEGVDHGQGRPPQVDSPPQAGT